MTRARLSRRAVLAGAAGVAVAGAGGTAAWRVHGRTRGRRVENEFLRIDFGDDGSVVGIDNKQRGLALVTRTARRSPPPWRVHLGDGSVVERPTRFAFDGAEGRVRLRWAARDGLELEAHVRLPPGEQAATFEIALRSPRAAPPVERLEYPVIGAIGALGGAGDESLLVHPHGTGFLFRDPLLLFEAEGEDPRRGLLHSPYPEGYSGASLQTMAYYVPGRGGFALGTEDATGAQKWLNFFKREDGRLEAAIVHGSGDVHEGNGLAPEYPVVVRALLEGSWTEAADKYKEWAVRQRWCRRGPLAERDDARWLHEDVGLVVFGVNAARDRAAWIDELGRIAGTPVLFVLGPNWTPVEQDYQNNFPGGLADWFPARFSHDNTAAIRRQGARFAPFYFDLLFGIYNSDHEAGVAALQAIPTPTASFDGYGFPYLCPATRFLRSLHRERDARLAGDYDADAVYYDISANNVIKQCFDVRHGHPRGGGRFMVEAYRDLYAASKRAMAQASGGRYVPQGTELVNEVFVESLDFYQARAEASPAAPLEGDQFREWIKDGRVEKVPLFTYVYHEYGPVRTDGWGKLSREQGDLFYWIAARVVVWGGIFQLNYEFSPLELVDGREEPLDEHYFPLPDHRYPIDPAKARFVAELATARTRFARDYLAYGTMLPPPVIESPTVELDWFHYNCPPNWPAYEDRGTQTVSAVVHAAWRHERKAGIVLVNVDRHEHIVSVPVGRGGLRLDGDGAMTVDLVTGDERRPLASFVADGAVDVPLPARKVVLVEVTPT